MREVLTFRRGVQIQESVLLQTLDPHLDIERLDTDVIRHTRGGAPSASERV